VNKFVEVIDLKKMDYKEAWVFQEKLFQETLSIKSNNFRSGTSMSTPNSFLFVEHPHVYTLGKSGHFENLLISDEKLESIGAKFYKINRGGDITYHGPGQIVGYPILDLENFFTDINRYLRLIEEMIILTLEEYDIKAERSKGETGVWLDVGTPFARKICAIGVRASRWVTMHGFALNVNTDLGYFDYMIPCGIKDKAVTSLKVELLRRGTIFDEQTLMEEAKEKVLKHFLNLFEASIYEKTEAEASI